MLETLYEPPVPEDAEPGAAREPRLHHRQLRRPRRLARDLRQHRPTTVAPTRGSTSGTIRAPAASAASPTSTTARAAPSSAATPSSAPRPRSGAALRADVPLHFGHFAGICRRSSGARSGWRCASSSSRASTSGRAPGGRAPVAGLRPRGADHRLWAAAGDARLGIRSKHQLNQ